MPVLFKMIATLALLAIGTPAIAQSTLAEYEALMGRRKPIPGLSDELRQIITSATPSRLVIKTTGGSDLALDISVFEPEEFVLLQGGRFLGFRFSGYEAGGYLVLDRARSDRPYMLGFVEPPSFSPDGRYVAGIMENEGGGLGEAPTTVGIWEVLPDRVAPRYYNGGLPNRQDWRVEGWSGACLLLSSTEEGWQATGIGEYADQLSAAHRVHTSIRMGNGSLHTNLERPACPDLAN